MMMMMMMMMMIIQTALRKKFWKKKLKVNADYVKNTKKLLTTQYQNIPLWQRRNTP